ncbi:MAG: UPF0001 protein YggS [Firmicutes bacterium]|nr:UPF0001 protein YggS [Bacillota bacterium]
MSIRSNIQEIEYRIAKAASMAGRSRDEIKLVGVTKTVGIETIKEAIEAGINVIGENRVQEMEEKYGKLLDYPLEWHLIGHLQSNKVKYIVDKVDLIHSIDRMSVVEEIEKRAAGIDRRVDVLLQVNVSGEETKFGIPPEKLMGFIDRARQCKFMNIKGLMTIAPYTEDPETVRPVFRKLHEIFMELKEKKLDGVSMEYLSMGMTGDFEVAIEEGANIVRIGSGIFGERKL